MCGIYRAVDSAWMWRMISHRATLQSAARAPVLQELRTAAKKADRVLLATDLIGKGGKRSLGTWLTP